MNKRLIITFGLLALLTATAVLINFDKPVDAAYLERSNQWGINGSHIYFNSGNVGIGNVPSPSSPLQVAGQIEATAFAYTSDANLKNEIVTLDNSLEKVLALRGVSFNWIDNGNNEIGLIAQEVEKVVPELVVTGNNDMKSVKYGNIVALLIEAVKEQQGEIEMLKAEVKNLSK